jgi:hypothetical protein
LHLNDNKIDKVKNASIISKLKSKIGNIEIWNLSLLFSIELLNNKIKGYIFNKLILSYLIILIG